MEADVRRFLATNFSLGDDPGSLSGDASLVEAGIIDSTGILELIGWLEDTYGIQVSDGELLPENLESIDNIVRFVERKRAARGAA